MPCLEATGVYFLINFGKASKPKGLISLAGVCLLLKIKYN